MLKFDRKLHLPEFTFGWNYISRKTYFPKFAFIEPDFIFTRNYIFPKTYFPEITRSSPKFHLVNLHYKYAKFIGLFILKNYY